MVPNRTIHHNVSTLFVCNIPLKIRKTRKISMLKKWLIVFEWNIWHSTQKALNVSMYKYMSFPLSSQLLHVTKMVLSSNEYMLNVSLDVNLSK